MVLAALALLSCGDSLKQTCELAALPARWRITASLLPPPEATPYGFPGSCPSIDLTVEVPASAGDVQSSVVYQAASTELGSTSSCGIFYRQGSPSGAGRTACGGALGAGSATTTTSAECFFEIGPPNRYGDSSYFCRYSATFVRVDGRDQ